jgi:hydrogenase-4 component F
MMVFFPWVGALILLALPRLRMAAAVNIGCAGVSFVLALALFTVPHGEQGWTRIDALNLPFVLLASFVALTTSIFSAATLAAEGFDHWRIRAYHGAFQVFLGAQYLALLSDNLGVLWVAIEIATLASVLMVAVHRTPAAMEAAWKFFMLCGFGIALALFGTILL